MDPLIQSDELSVTITTPFEADFIVNELFASEAISELYEIIVDVHTTDIEIDLNEGLGGDASVSLSYQESDGTIGNEIRTFSGVIGKIHQKQTFVTDEGETLAYYTFYIYPKLWVTKFNKDCRVFQEETVYDITETLLEEYEVDDYENEIEEISDSERVYCVQYNESVFQFLSRLWEEEGVSYFFTHHSEGSTLNIISDTESYVTALDPETIPLQNYKKSTLTLNAIQKIEREVSVVSSKYDTKDYDQENASSDLGVESEESEHQGGRVFEYPGIYKTLDQGEELAAIRTQEIEWNHVLVKGESTVIAFTPHSSFTLADHPREDWNDSYILYKVEHHFKFHKEGERSTKVYQNKFWAFPATVPFRPQRKTPKPRIYSHQTAIVVGSAGEEIETDEFGRIKVQFHWDQYGEKDEDSSMWVRVAQTWSGAGWGMVVTPRIGMEVVVAFTNGDPDKPLVIGCVYNSSNTPPYDVDSPTKTVWRSRSSPNGTGETDYNEISFEDEQGWEEIFCHAAKDWRTVIEDNREELIVDGDDDLTLTKGSKSETLEGSGTTRSTTIANGDYSIDIGQGDYSATLGAGDHDTALSQGDMSIDITQGDMSINLDSGDMDITITSGDYTLTLSGGDLSIEVTGDIAVQATGDIDFECNGDMYFKADGDIDMEAGGDITLDGKDISLDGRMIDFTATLTIDGMAGLAIAWMTGLAFEAMALLSVEMMALLKAELQGMLNASVSGATVKINMG